MKHRVYWLKSVGGSNPLFIVSDNISEVVLSMTKNVVVGFLTFYRALL